MQDFFEPVWILDRYFKTAKQNSIFLFDLPTGFGKTRAVINYISKVIKSGNLDKKIIFVTNIKKDLQNPILKLKERLDLVEHKRITLFDGELKDFEILFIEFEEFKNYKFKDCIIFIDEFDSSKSFLKSKPERFIVDIAENNYLIAISATVRIKTIFDNYDFGYLKKYINIHTLLKDEIEALQKETDLRDINYKNIDIYKTILDRELNSNLKLCYKSFLDKNIFSFLAFVSDIELIDRDFLDLDYIEVLRFETFWKDIERIKEKLLNFERVFVITEYRSVGAGQNIHYEITEKIKESLNLIKLYNKEREYIKKDFDAIFLDSPYKYLLDKSKLNFVDRNSLDYKNYLIKIALQSIGRINKTNLKSQSIYLFLDREFQSSFKKFDYKSFVLIPETKSLFL